MNSNSNSNRYKDTLYYLDRGQRRLGVFKMPVEFANVDKSTWKTITVTSADVGRWDSLAVKIYGPSMESMWWAILAVNGIVNPSREILPGTKLYVPPSELVDRFLAR